MLRGLRLLLLVLLVLHVAHSKEGTTKKRRKGKGRNHKSLAKAAVKNGDLETAIQYFRKHVVANPQDAAGYNNLGVALMRHGIELENVNMLVAAKQSFMVSVDVSGPSPSTSDNLRLIEQYLKDRETANTVQVEADGTATEATPLTAAEKRKKKNTLLRQRINSACQEKQVRIKVRGSDHKKGVLSGKKLMKAHHILDLCGVVILERLFTPEFMEEVRVDQDKVVDAFLKGVQDDPTQTNSTSSEQRSPGRYELLSPMAPPFTSEELLRNPLLLPLMQRTLGTSRIEVDTHSSVTSMGETPAQHWHRDAGFIFKTQTEEQLPPHGEWGVVIDELCSTKT